MARMTKHEAGQIVETFYGIDPKTFEVERISLTKGGALTKSGPNMQSYNHPIYHGRDPRTEVVVVWGLTDIISFREGIFTSEQVKESVDGLKALAAEKKAAAEKK